MTPQRENNVEPRVRNLEVQVGTILQRLKQVEDWIPESREFHTEMNNFKSTLLAQQQATREEQSRRHAENSAKLNWLMFLVAVGTLIITGIGVVVSIQLAHHQALNKLISTEPPMVTAQFNAKDE